MGSQNLNNNCTCLTYGTEYKAWSSLQHITGTIAAKSLFYFIHHSTTCRHRPISKVMSDLCQILWFVTTMSKITSPCVTDKHTVHRYVNEQRIRLAKNQPLVTYTVSMLRTRESHLATALQDRSVNRIRSAFWRITGQPAADLSTSYVDNMCLTARYIPEINGDNGAVCASVAAPSSHAPDKWSWRCMKLPASSGIRLHIHRWVPLRIERMFTLSCFLLA